MPRLRRHESQMLTRERLRRAAGGAFAIRGVSASSVDAIAESAGFSRGAFYSNYKSKRELLLEVVQEQQEREIALWQELIQEASDLDALLPMLASRFDAYAATRENWLLAVELQLEAERDPEFGLLYRAHARQVMTRVAELMRALIAKSGRGVTLDVGVAAVAFRSLTHGLMFSNTNGDLLGDRTPGEAITLFLRGILDAGSAPSTHKDSQ